MTDEKLPAPAASAMPADLTSGAVWSSFQAMAKDPTIDPQKMQTMYQLQRDMVADMRQEEFNRAKFAAMADMPTITRNKVVTNKAGDIMYRYSDFKHLYLAVRPILAENGLILDFDVDETSAETKPPMLRVAPILRHRNGHVWHGSYMPVPITAPNSTVSLTQASKGAVETGKRTTLISCLGIVEEEDQSILPDNSEAPGWASKVLEDAQRAAAGGTDSYAAMWRVLNPMQRGWLVQEGHHQSLKEAAAAHDNGV